MASTSKAQSLVYSVLRNASFVACLFTLRVCVCSFMYSFMDTADPMRNLPAPIEAPAFSLTLDAMARLLPNTTSGVSFWSLFMEGINHRYNGESSACALG